MITFRFFKKIIVTKVNNDSDIEEVDVLMYCGPKPTETPLMTIMIDDDFMMYEEEVSIHGGHVSNSIEIPIITEEPIITEVPMITDEILIVNELMCNKHYSLGFTTLYEVCSHFMDNNEIINKIDGDLDMYNFCQSNMFEISPTNSYASLLDGEYWLSNGTDGRKVIKNGTTLNFISDCVSCGTEPNTMFVKYNTL